MREIKFRAWDIKDKIMCYPECFIFNQDWSYDTNWSAWENVKFDDRTLVTSQRQSELMQYTGIKDKNGKEIYEGDIVKISESSVYQEIYWNNLIAGFTLYPVSDILEDIPEYNFDEYEIEIIGNKFENPELLEDK